MAAEHSLWVLSIIHWANKLIYWVQCERTTTTHLSWTTTYVRNSRGELQHGTPFATPVCQNPPQHPVIWIGICGKKRDFYSHLVPLTKHTPDHPPSTSVLYKPTTPWSSLPYFCNLHMTTGKFQLTFLPFPTMALPKHIAPPHPLAQHPNHNCLHFLEWLFFLDCLTLKTEQACSYKALITTIIWQSLTSQKTLTFITT